MFQGCDLNDSDSSEKLLVSFLGLINNFQGLMVDRTQLKEHSGGLARRVVQTVQLFTL